MVVAGKQLKGLDGKGFLVANVRVTVLNDGTVEINCNNHLFILLSLLFP